MVDKQGGEMSCEERYKSGRSEDKGWVGRRGRYTNMTKVKMRDVFK
jgi:hypothetical protein